MVGMLPAGPSLQAKAKFIFYGAYPNDDLWRVNLTYALGGFMLAWVMIERLPYRKIVGILLLTVLPCHGNSSADWRGVLHLNGHNWCCHDFGSCVDNDWAPWKGGLCIWSVW